MKNNRLTNSEFIILQDSIDRINDLASLENASFFPFDNEMDKRVKERVRLYMIWFECEAKKIQKIIDSNN